MDGDEMNDLYSSIADLRLSLKRAEEQRDEYRAERNTAALVALLMTVAALIGWWMFWTVTRY